MRYIRYCDSPTQFLFFIISINISIFIFIFNSSSLQFFRLAIDSQSSLLFFNLYSLQLICIFTHTFTSLHNNTTPTKNPQDVILSTHPQSRRFHLGCWSRKGRSCCKSTQEFHIKFATLLTYITDWRCWWKRNCAWNPRRNHPRSWQKQGH